MIKQKNLLILLMKSLNKMNLIRKLRLYENRVRTNSLEKLTSLGFSHFSLDEMRGIRNFITNNLNKKIFKLN